MPIGKTILIATILMLSIVSGCTLLRPTKFSLLSARIDDDSGFPRMSLQFNTSGTSTLILTDPQHNLVFSDIYYYGIHNESIYLSQYRTSVVPGRYTLKVLDASKNTIFTHELLFYGYNLSLISIDGDWWNNIFDSSVIAFHLNVKNSGDLPAYPFTISISNNKTPITAYVLPAVVLSSHTTQLTCFFSPEKILTGTNQLNISIFDHTGTLLLNTTFTSIEKNPVDSWTYQWYYQGSQNLQIPEVDWLYDYYSSMKRFNIIDYSLYVFDRYDDSYIEFVVNKILSLKKLKTNEEKINFIASFVQDIEYQKDDPQNETYEYPRYPLETLKEKRGDCEDKAILTAALLKSIGYNVSLLRLPEHMAVGVHLNETISGFSYYIDQYYFLETTTLFSPLGKIPPEYQSLTNITVYPINSRPLLVHTWKNATRFTISTGTDYVNIKAIIENLGTISISNIEIRGAFYDNASNTYNQEKMFIPIIGAGEKRLIELTVDVPSNVSVTLKTQLYMNGIKIDEYESLSRFP